MKKDKFKTDKELGDTPTSLVPRRWLEEAEKKNQSWKGWAIAAVWIGTGLASFGAGVVTVFIGLFAMIATCEIVGAE